MANNEQGRLNIQIGIDNTKLAQDALESQRIINGIGSTAVEEGAAIDSAMKKVGMAIGGVFTMQQALSFASQVISVRKEIESLEVSFRTLLGSKQQADALLGQIREFAVNTPMQLNDLARGAQTLLSFNYEADKVMRTLQALGDISMGDSAKFNSLTLAFAQMSSTGKLMGQDLMQMINAGFNPLSVISEQTGKSIGDLKDEMSAGAISSKMVEDAFIAATSAGGKFYGMLAAQSKTLGGSISNLQGAIDDMFNSIGENTQGIVSGAIDGLTLLAKNYKAVGEAIAVLIGLYGTYKAAVAVITLYNQALAMAEVQKNLAAKEGIAISTAQALKYLFQAKAAATATSATAGLNATLLANPYALVFTAVVALGYGIYKLATYETEADKAAKELKKSQEDCNAEIAKEMANLDMLFGTLEGATRGSEDFKNAKQAIIEQYGKYLNGVDLEKASIDELAQIYNNLALEIEKAAKARAMAAFTEKVQTKYGETYGSAATDIRQALVDKYGEKQGSTYYIKLKPVIEGKSTVAHLDKELQGVVNSYNRVQQQFLAPGTPAYTYTTNVILDGIKKITDARKVMNIAIAEGRDIFGDAPEQNKPDSKPENYQKGLKAARKRLTDAQSNLKKLQSDAKATTEQVKAAKAEVEAATKALKDTYGVDVKAEASAAKKAAQQDKKNTKEANQQAIAEAQRKAQLDQINQRRVVEARQYELEVEQARVDAMDEGFAKELAQNELNYKKLQEQNIQRKEQMIEQLRDIAQIQWEIDNPKAKDNGQSFDRNSVSANILDAGFDISQLPQKTQAIINTMLAQLAEYDRIANEQYANANKKTLTSVLDGVLSYEQQRQKIEQEYADKRKALYNGDGTLKNGVKQENIDELNRQQDEALKAIDEQFAQREVDYQAWCDAIGELSLKQLTDLLDKAKQELAKLKGEGVKDGRLAVAEAKVNTLTDKVNKGNATDKLAPKKRTIKEWQDLYSTLNECASAFNDIGDAVGDTAGEAIKAAGQMATSTLSIINGIMTLANSSGNAIQGVSTAASKAISTVEKASVILTIVSTALQIAMAIANLFNDDAQKQEEIDRLQSRIDQLQWELDNTDIMQMQAQYGTSVERTLKHIQEARQAMIDTAEATGNWYEKMIAYNTQISKSTTMLQKAVKAMADEYEKMSYTADKALGEAKYNSYYDYLKNISEQQILIQEQIDQEASKKDTDDDKIKEWKRKIEELGQQALSLVNDLVEEIIGGSAEDIAERLSDAFFDAFENGEEAAKAWGDEVKKIVGDIVKQMMIKQVLETEIGKIFDKYKAMWFNDGKFVGAEAVRQSMDAFMSDLNNTYDTFSQLWDALPEELKTLLTGDSEREGASRGIASASQDSIDELNARATTIQSHTYSISENTKLLVSNTNAILNSVLAIEAHTESLTKQMAAVESELYRVRTSVDDFTTKGIKIK